MNEIICKPAEQFLKELEPGIIDLTVTSPPYDGLRKYNGYSFPFEEIAAELFRVTKYGGVVVWVVGDQTKKGSESGTSFRQALFFMSLGFNLHDTMIYKKSNPVPLSHNRYEQCFEYMFVFSKGKPNTFNPIMVPCKGGGKEYSMNNKGVKVPEASTRARNETRTFNTEKIHINLFEYPVGIDRAKHPAAFPELLAADQISSWSNRGDLVCDPFSGSGTTAKMAIEYGRQFIGCDISQEYVDLGNKRIAPMLAQTKLFTE